MARVDRSRRVSEQIKRHLSVLINKEVSDPRLGMVGVSAVDISKDFKLATVYVNVFKEDEIEGSMLALRSAAGFLRSQLSQSLNQRSTPKLAFEHDTSIQKGIELSRLIDSVQ
jgi:ribosome-binding factor A